MNQNYKIAFDPSEIVKSAIELHTKEVLLHNIRIHVKFLPEKILYWDYAALYFVIIANTLGNVIRRLTTGSISVDMEITARTPKTISQRIRIQYPHKAENDQRLPGISRLELGVLNTLTAMMGGTFNMLSDEHDHHVITIDNQFTIADYRLYDIRFSCYPVPVEPPSNPTGTLIHFFSDTTRTTCSSGTAACRISGRGSQSRTTTTEFRTTEFYCST